MKTTPCAILLLGASIAAVSAQTNAVPSPPVASREQRWKEDLDYFARELPARHLDFYKLIPKKTFDREVRNLKRELPRLSDLEVVFRLMRLGARLGVAHTWVGYPPKEPAIHGYPFMVAWYSDELMVASAAPQYRGIVGARVVKIGGTTPRRAVAKVAPYNAHENKVGLYYQSQFSLRNAELLQLLKIARPDGTLHLSLLQPDGTPFSVDIAPDDSAPMEKWIPYWQAMGVAPPLYVRNDAPYWHEFLPEARALYVQYRECTDYPDRPFASFARDVFACAESNAVQRVIIDLRANRGGDNGVLRPLLNGLKARPCLNGKDHLFVLIGPATLSSGMDAAIQLRNEAGGVLVGRPTGEKPNGYGESPSFRPPNSQMEVHYSTKYFTHFPNTDPPWLVPDIVVAPSVKEILAGRDPILERALSRRQESRGR